MTLTFYFTFLATLYVLTGTILFGFRKTRYSHLKNTISELGESGAEDQNKVNYGFFLPVGLILLAVAALRSDSSSAGLALVLAIGYLVAAFFPCDTGSPISGSWKQQVHNLGGFIQYVGAIYFINDTDISLFGVSNKVLLIILIVCLTSISIPGFTLRGLAQRIAELIIFGCLIKLTYL